MQTVIVTDGKYRSSLTTMRTLSEFGYRVIVTQTRAESNYTPAVFYSNFVDETIWIDGSCKDDQYKQRLLDILSKYDRPVLLCIGAITLNLVSKNREAFEEFADFLISENDVLESLNDKKLSIDVLQNWVCLFLKNLTMEIYTIFLWL